MSITQRGDMHVADLREYVPGLRVSMHTRNADVARVLHQELVQRCMRGEEITRGVVKGLLQALASPSLTASLPSAAMSPARAVQAKQRAGITLHQAFALAMVNHEKWRTSKSPRTINENYAFVEEHFGRNRPLSEITTQDTARYRAALIEEKKSASTVNQRMSVLSVLFDVAGDEGHPVEKPRFKRLRQPPGRIRTFSTAEEKAIITWFRTAKEPLRVGKRVYEKQRLWNLDMADLTIVLIDTGFRLGELLRVHDRRDVDWDEERIFARDTKNGTDRAVPMTSRVKEIMKRRGGAHCWLNEEGEPLPFGMLTVFAADHQWRHMRTGLKMQGDKHFIIHSLRHTCATRLALKGMDAFRIMAWMGHKSINTTMIYVNLAGQGLKGLRDALEQQPEKSHQREEQPA